MTPAHMRAKPVALPEDVAGLWDALEASAEGFGPHHFQTLAIAHTLAISLWQAGDFENATAILKQAVECLASAFGTSHPATLAAQGDFAAILLELGQDAQGSAVEREAFESARAHLGKAHPVTTVLAWNRALNCESAGDSDGARAIITSELTWLLTEPPARLEEDQSKIRSMLAERLQWDAPRAC
jgi:hypothetical protein